MSVIIVGPCVKCGGEKIATRYVKEREWHQVSSYDDDKARDEHLRHRCENCGYSWNTPTLDAPKSANVASDNPDLYRFA